MAATLGVPPILSYAFQAMVNWRRIDPAGPVAVGNLVLLQNFLGGMDEEWFVTLHITIEAAAGRALAHLLPAQAAVTQGEDAAVAYALHEVAATLQTLHDLLGRMEERCDPYIYYHRVRPFMFGWKDNPAMPGGLIYEGVTAFGGQPQQFRGETGAQSGVIPAIDGSWASRMRWIPSASISWSYGTTCRRLIGPLWQLWPRAHRSGNTCVAEKRIPHWSTHKTGPSAN